MLEKNPQPWVDVADDVYRIHLGEMRRAFGLTTPAFAWLEDGIVVDRVAPVETVTSGVRDQETVRLVRIVVRRRDHEAARRPLDRRRMIEARRFDPRIATVATQRFVDGHAADAVHRAAEVLVAEVRARSRLTSDGRDLMAKAFADGAPLRDVRLDAGEAEAVKMLFMGACGALRNPNAHSPGSIEDDDALDQLSFLNMLLRRVK